MASAGTGELEMSPGVSKTKWNSNGSPHQITIPETSLDVSLSYEGKRDEAVILATQPAKTCLIWEGETPENLLYYGDNLCVLPLLLANDSLRGKVRLVYIDPPFATRSVYQSRSQKDAYQDLLSGAHYIEFLRERLIFLRELLAEDGSIYVHLDENMAFHVKVIMDEVFGRANFRNWITRKKCNPNSTTIVRFMF